MVLDLIHDHLILDFDSCKNVIIFGIDNSLAKHTDNRKNIYFSLWWRTNTTIAAVSKYFIKFTVPKKKFCLSLHYSESTRFFYVDSVKMYRIKAKDLEIKP